MSKEIVKKKFILLEDQANVLPPFKVGNKLWKYCFYLRCYFGKNMSDFGSFAAKEKFRLRKV